MKKIQFNKVLDVNILSPLKVEWRKSLTAPQDDMWEAFMKNSIHWEIKLNDKIIGYACVNADNHLLQFFLVPEWMQEGISLFKQFINSQKIKKAVVGTNNPFFLTVAMHYQKSIKIDTYLFTEFVKGIVVETEGTLNLAKPKDLDKLVIFCHDSTGAPKEWLKEYINNLINRHDIFVFEKDTEILGTCEVRRNENNPLIANIGMIVSPAYRRKGLGTFLLGKAKEMAIKRNKQPICSCERDNIGSLKSIQKNGFRSIHQILLMEF